MSRPRASRLFLTGFSGSGKSTVAGLLAERFEWDVLDTDLLIENESGTSIPELFVRDGEARFRELERDAIGRACQREHVVVATGGGAVLAKENRLAMGRAGVVVCLEARPVTLFRRLEHGPSGRPLLEDADPLRKLVDLKASRQSCYRLADAIIDTNDSDAKDVAAATLQAIADPTWAMAHPDRLLTPEERGKSIDAVNVAAESNTYSARAGWGLLNQLGECMKEAGLTGTAFLISDPTVMMHHGDIALQSLRNAGFDAHPFSIDQSGERAKSLHTASQIYDLLVERRAERSDTVVALGGGVIGDIAGFVAATYLRGMPFVQAPTSLLAMVDASIGGKSGVDHPRGKNLIGAFHQPRLVLADVSTLKTLPPKLLAEGAAEAIKHALILDPGLLDDMESQASDLLHLEPLATAEIVRRNVAIKASVVAEDELDTGRRAILNYGHTVAHAIEAAAGFEIGHGAADAIGMMAAAMIGVRVGVTPELVIERQRTIFQRYGLPTGAPGLDVEAVLSAMALDKKSKSGAIRWVLLEDIGRATTEHEVPADTVTSVLKELFA
jgi:3-dehydroquinate synthase